MNAKSNPTKQPPSPSSASPIIIGLTGGIGSGKTAVSDWFARHGIAVVDADVIAHNITQKDSPTLLAIAEHFGAWMLDSEGNYNRSAMRAYIFDKPDELHSLNQITHPVIRTEILNQLHQATSAYTILSVPLLFEGRTQTPNLLELCHRVLVVDVPVATQLARASGRDNKSLTDIQAIINRQTPRDERLALADDIVDNSGSLMDLHTKLMPLHKKYLSLSRNQNA